MYFKNSLEIFWLSPRKSKEKEVNSKYFFLLFASGKFVTENQILFALEAEMHVLNNGEIDYSCPSLYYASEAVYCTWPITETCLYNFDPLKPHFNIVKLVVDRGVHYFSYFCTKT